MEQELNRKQKNELIKEKIFEELNNLTNFEKATPVKITDEYLNILNEEMENKNDFIY
ncbi:hypothetical protein [Sutterella wadsworthensis]|uniref:hypothetical protein n=1 Tax=Sutterella wadsworthensis TaxID=40545 RepID=UPI0032BFB91D